MTKHDFLLEEIKTSSIKELSQKYKVSQSTIYKWLSDAGYSKKINSKKKGKRGELEAAHEFQKYGIQARRTAQVRGKNNGCADLEGVPGYWVEVKRNEHLSIKKAMDQAVRDSVNTSDIPIVMHRKNRSGWLITIRESDLNHSEDQSLITMSFNDFIKISNLS